MSGHLQDLVSAAAAMPLNFTDSPLTCRAADQPRITFGCVSLFDLIYGWPEGNRASESPSYPNRTNPTLKGSRSSRKFYRGALFRRYAALNVCTQTHG